MAENDVCLRDSLSLAFVRDSPRGRRGVACYGEIGPHRASSAKAKVPALRGVSTEDVGVLFFIGYFCITVF